MGQKESKGDSTSKGKAGPNSALKKPTNSDSLSKIEKELIKEQARNLPPLEVTTIEDFPPEYREKISKSGIDLATADKHLDVTINILHFLYKRRFKRLKKADAKDENGHEDKEKTEETESKKPASTLPSDDDPLTEEELKKEAKMLNDGDVTKIFKSFQSHGSGGFGTVERAKHIKSKAIVAIKRVPHQTNKQKRANITEISFLKVLKQKRNIVEYFGTYKQNDELWIIMEFMEGGTLSQALKTWTFKEAQIAYFAREVLRGLNSLHESNFAHRDIKPHNIMLDVDGNVKLIDFGLCIDLNIHKSPKNMVGSAYWMSPEMLKKQSHDCKVDIFSLGMVIYELMNGEPLTSSFKPFQAMFYNATTGGPPLDLLTKPKEGKDVEPWSPQLVDFLRQCLTKDPKKRPSANELLGHPIMKSADEPSEMKRILKLIFLSTSLQLQGIGI